MPGTMKAFQFIIVCEQPSGYLLSDLSHILQKVGCDGVIGSNAVVDRCGVCNGDGSTCLPGSRDSVAKNNTNTKKAFTPGAANLITSALAWLKRMGYDVDRRGQIASPESTTKDTAKDDFYWAVVKSGCSVSCGGGIHFMFPFLSAVFVPSFVLSTFFFSVLFLI